MTQHRKLFFEKVNEAHAKGLIGNETLRDFYDRLPILERSVGIVERASGLKYPSILFEPSLVMIKYPTTTLSRTVIYASTKIDKIDGTYQLCVEFSLPFLLYASEDTLRACAAHEFLHYIFNTIALSIKAFATLSGERLDSREVHIAYDDTHAVQPEDWFEDRMLIQLVKEKFKPDIADEELEMKIKTNWVDNGLPIRIISVDESKQSVPILEVPKIPLDEEIMRSNKARRFFLHVH
jgi:hypothetical protein